MNTETWIACSVTYLPMVISQKEMCKAAPLDSATAAHTRKPTVFMKGSVHCSTALPRPMHYLGVKIKRQGGGLGILWRQIVR